MIRGLAGALLRFALDLLIARRFESHRPSVGEQLAPRLVASNRRPSRRAFSSWTRCSSSSRPRAARLPAGRVLLGGVHRPRWRRLRLEPLALA
jgi:hypothetical protein